MFFPSDGYGEQYGVTSIIIAHANKQSGVWGRKRIADSSDIWDGCSVLMVGTCPDSNMRYISQESQTMAGFKILFYIRLMKTVFLFLKATQKRKTGILYLQKLKKRPSGQL